MVGIGKVEWRELCAIFWMTRVVRTLEIACDSCKQKLYRLNRPQETLDSVYLRIPSHNQDKHH